MEQAKARFGKSELCWCESDIRLRSPELLADWKSLHGTYMRANNNEGGEVCETSKQRDYHQW